MNHIEISAAYLKHLQAGDIAQVVGLFSDTGTVESPIYGTKSAQAFYQALAADTQASKLTHLGTFEEAETGNIALYFRYQWTLADGREVDFKVVDILTFNEADKIQNLTIIYDTVHSRQAVENLEK